MIVAIVTSLLANVTCAQRFASRRCATGFDLRVCEAERADVPLVIQRDSARGSAYSAAIGPLTRSTLIVPVPVLLSKNMLRKPGHISTASLT